MGWHILMCKGQLFWSGHWSFWWYRLLCTRHFGRAAIIWWSSFRGLRQVIFEHDAIINVMTTTWYYHHFVCTRSFLLYVFEYIPYSDTLAIFYTDRWFPARHTNLELPRMLHASYTLASAIGNCCHSWADIDPLNGHDASCGLAIILVLLWTQWTGP